MAISEVSLSSAARANLTALKNTASLLEATQTRLSSGKKVNSALDNASSYFQSEGFLNSANDLDGLKDSMSTALQTIQSATDAIESITTIINQMQALVNSALQTTDNDTRATYASQFDDLRAQLDDLADDATFNGTNLVNSLSAELQVNFNATNTTSLTIQSKDLTSGGMGVGASVNDWESNTLAEEKTYNLTVSADTYNNSAALLKTAELQNLAVSGVIASNNSDGAVFTSTATVDLSGTVATTTGAVITDAAGASAAVALAAITAFSNAGIAAVYTADTTTGGAADSRIEGQFTVTGGSGTANSLTIGANATMTAGAAGATGFTITVGVGETIRVVSDDGTGDAAALKTRVFTNTSSGAISFYSGAATDNVTLQGSADSTLEYTLDTGTVSTTQLADGTALSLPITGTIDGKDLVESTNASVGETFTYSITSAAASGATAGVTTSAGTEIAYDISNATLTSIQAASVRATMTNNNATTGITYGIDSENGTTVNISNGTKLTGSLTTTIADSLTTAQNQLSDSLTTLRAAASELGNNNTLVQTRLDFTESMISTLQVASDNLTLADTNEEGANMQALQAQSQLGIVALGISGEQAQAILRLF